MLSGHSREAAFTPIGLGPLDPFSGGGDEVLVDVPRFGKGLASHQHQPG